MWRCRRRHAMWWAALALLAGCANRGDQPELGQVSGTVTLDGEPLAEALVLFGPMSGRTSSGVTDGDGKYELIYLYPTKGAKVGSHIVTITTYYPDEDSPEALTAKETIPSRYNARTTLTAEVARGTNVIDFELASE